MSCSYLPAAAILTGLFLSASPVCAADDSSSDQGGRHHGPPPLQIDFTKADTNGDGYLSQTEFTAAVKAALKNGPGGKGGQRPPPPPSGEGDGGGDDMPPPPPENASSQSSSGSSQSGHRQGPPPIPDEAIAAAFTKGDANSDSKLTSDETKAAVKALMESMRPPKGERPNKR